jgi:RNA polymerase sigma-70 factor (ECF subfamily)
VEQDQELVKRCLTGDNSAWDALLRAYTRKIYNLCYRFTGRTQDAEDLTQEIFIKIFQTLRSYDSAQGSFSTWMNRVSRNHLVDHYRRSKRDRLTSSIEDELGTLEEKPSPNIEPISQIEAREIKDKLQLALNKLSPDLREAVVLRDLHDLDYQEIAIVLRVPEGTVKSRINRGRLELARVLKRMEGMRGAAKAGSEP